MEGTPYPFRLSLVDENNTLFVRDGPAIDPTALQIYSLEDIEKRNFFSRLVSSEKKGGYLGLKIPIKETSFSLLVDVPEQSISEVESHEIFSRITTFFFLTLLIGGGGALWLTRRMSRPLKNLIVVMERVGDGDLTARFEKDAMGFEINVLGNNFNQMIDSLLKHMEEAKNERVARVLLENELKIGQEIQMSIIPREMPKVPGLDLAAGLVPAREVSGDYYDLFFKTEQNRLILSIADASGKGISACLYSLCVRSLIRSFTASHESFSEAIRLTNRLFCLDTGDTGAFVTAWIGSLDLNTKQLDYSCCGHPPALLKRKNGTIEELATPNPAFGVIEYDKVYTSSVTLSSGDLLLLYTDGLIEAHNSQMQLFGKSRLFEIVNAAQDKSAQDMVQYFMEEVSQFEKGSPQYDDLTLLVVRVL